jgi:serine/threonine-protein kinase haspin
LIQWLHYLSLKLLKAKRLKAPAISRKTTTAPQATGTFSERECYESLVEMERLLSGVVGKPKAKSAARRKTQASVQVKKVITDGPASAVEVVAFGFKRKWVQ